MKREEFIQEVASRISVSEQTASLMLHAVFGQVLNGLSIDEEVFIPKLGKWRLIRNRNKEGNILFEPSEQFVQTLALSRFNQSYSSAGSKRLQVSNRDMLSGKGYFSQTIFQIEESKGNSPVNLINVYKSISSELGTQDFRPQIPTPTQSELRSPARQVHPMNSADNKVKDSTIQKELQDIIVSTGVLQTLPVVATAKKNDLDQKSEIEAEEEIEKQFETEAALLPDSKRLRPSETKSPVLRFTAYFFTVCVVCIGLYFLYTDGLLNHLLPKKYQHQTKTNFPQVRSGSIHTSDSSVQTSSHSPKQKIYKYFLTVRILQKEFDASSRLKQLELQGFYGRIEKSTKLIVGKRWYEVKLGPYAIRDTAIAVAQRFQDTFGYPPTEDSTHIK